jgi:Tfp pilus assembly protein PilZ
MERRQERRVNCEATLFIQRGSDTEKQFKEQVAADVSLGGVLFRTDEAYTEGEEVTISISIPEAARREFPFSRLAGRARVARVLPLTGQRKKFEVALAFGRDITTLMAVPAQG